MAKWKLVWHPGSDYYLGQKATLFKDGFEVWSDYTGDQAEELVRAILGDDFEVEGNPC